MVRARALVLAALASVAGCARRCATPLDRVTVLERAGAGWQLDVRCELSTRVRVDRSAEPFLHGCRVATTARVRTHVGELRAELPGGAASYPDCDRARAFCRAARGSVLERATPEGRVIGVGLDGAGAVLLLGVTPDGAPVMDPRGRVAGALAPAVAAAQSPEALVLAALEAGDLSPRYRDDPNGFERAVRGRLLAAHRDDVLARALACEARPSIMEALLREHADASFEPLFRRAYLAPAAGDACGAIRDAVFTAARDRLGPRLVRALGAQPPPPPATAWRLVRLAVDLRERGAVPYVHAIARDVQPADAPRDARWSWHGALWALVALDRAGATAALAPLLRAQPEGAPSRHPPAPYSPNEPGPMLWATPAEALAQALRAVDTPASREALAAIAQDAALPASTRQLAGLVRAPRRAASDATAPP